MLIKMASMVSAGLSLRYCYIFSNDPRVLRGTYEVDTRVDRLIHVNLSSRSVYSDSPYAYRLVVYQGMLQPKIDTQRLRLRSKEI